MIQAIFSLLGLGLIGSVFMFIGYIGIRNRDSDEFHSSPYNRGHNSPSLNVVGSLLMILVGLAIMSLGVIPLIDK